VTLTLNPTYLTIYHAYAILYLLFMSKTKLAWAVGQLFFLDNVLEETMEPE